MPYRFRDSNGSIELDALPTTWYHGTQNEFERFEMGHKARSSRDFNTHLGFHFTPDFKVAESFALGRYKNRLKKDAGTVLEVELAVKHPAVFDTEFDLDQSAYRFFRQTGLLSNQELKRWMGNHESWWLIVQEVVQGGRMAEFFERKLERDAHRFLAELPARARNQLAEHYREYLIEQGHDGALYGNWMETGVSIVVFDPDVIQIHNRIQAREIQRQRTG